MLANQWAWTDSWRPLPVRTKLTKAGVFHGRYLFLRQPECLKYIWSSLRDGSSNRNILNIVSVETCILIKTNLGIQKQANKNVNQFVWFHFEHWVFKFVEKQFPKHFVSPVNFVTISKFLFGWGLWKQLMGMSVCSCWYSRYFVRRYKM